MRIAVVGSGIAGVGTIAEDRSEEYRSRPDFIQRYIFPGGMHPSPERFIRLWRYYLAYCRAGFLSGNVDVMQVRLGA